MHMKANTDAQRILIVEDEPRVADALSRMLTMPQNGGHQVVACDTGEAALAKLRAEQFDLVITDLRMPGISGLELLDRTRHISPNTRSVLITAFGSTEVEYQARQLANAYLTKPFSLQSFIQAVQQALGSPAIPLPPMMAFSDDGLRAIQQRLDQLHTEIGALSILLADWSGQIIVECGERHDAYSDVLLALLGNSMAAATEVARLLHEENGFDLHYHEGNHFEIYSAMVNETIYLALLFDRRLVGSRIGLVSLYMRRAIEDLRGLLNSALIEPGEAASLHTGMASAMDAALDDAFDFAHKPLPISEPQHTQSRAKLDDPIDSTLPSAMALNSLQSGVGGLLTFEQARSRGLLDRAGV